MILDEAAKAVAASLSQNGLPPFPPEYVVLAVPAHLRAEDNPDVDDVDALLKILCEHYNAKPVSLTDKLYYEASRRVAWLGHQVVDDANWPWSFQIAGDVYRLMVMKVVEGSDSPVPAT